MNPTTLDRDHSGLKERKNITSLPSRALTSMTNAIKGALVATLMSAGCGDSGNLVKPSCGKQGDAIVCDTIDTTDDATTSDITVPQDTELPQDTYTPPQDTYIPPQDTYVPQDTSIPQDTLLPTDTQPPQDTMPTDTFTPPGPGEPCENDSECPPNHVCVGWPTENCTHKDQQIAEISVVAPEGFTRIEAGCEGNESALKTPVVFNLGDTMTTANGDTLIVGESNAFFTFGVFARDKVCEVQADARKVTFGRLTPETRLFNAQGIEVNQVTTDTPVSQPVPRTKAFVTGDTSNN
ncbi:hypothetical protein CVV38_03450 [Candidatus Peregrinibacteria bacterium HGW-Peregrinibacteria-1]|nr:MAG: hypothetical protein CVV38_03450 [Candidatus Peregrinibacteria bacterium HGW-Peregrinibacteria-1]